MAGVHRVLDLARLQLPAVRLQELHDLLQLALRPGDVLPLHVGAVHVQVDPTLHVAAAIHFSIFILDLQHLHRVELHVGAAATEELLHIVGGVSEGVVGAEHVNVLRVAEPVVATTEEEEGY